MEYDFNRVYSFCDNHKEKVGGGGRWETLSEPDTCDYLVRKIRCKKKATWEFYPGERWD